ncbi:MAG: hypothetical protein HY585_02025 [Candidatus Omnitrophica bacterium]|nr:hypothetical protein [Candidatus Omnitrophota bacterium]
MGNLLEPLKEFVKERTYALAISGTVLLALFLLFLDDLASPLRYYLVPSLAVYVLGEVLVSQFQSVLRTQLIVYVRIGWFGLFILYNLIRGAL